MVGDAEDQKRWKLVRQYSRAAADCERRAIAAETPQYLRAGLLERANELRFHAHHLTV